MAAAKGPSDRAANSSAGERNQPVRCDRQSGPGALRPVPGAHAAPARCGPVRRPVGNGIRSAPGAPGHPGIADSHRRQPAADRHSGPVRSRPFVPRADGRAARPGRRSHRVLQGPSGIAARAGKAGLSGACRLVETRDRARDRGSGPARYQPVQRPTHPACGSGRCRGDRWESAPQALLSDRTSLQHLLSDATGQRFGPLDRGPHPLHGLVLRSRRTEGSRRPHRPRCNRARRGRATVLPLGICTAYIASRPGTAPQRIA